MSLFHFARRDKLAFAVTYGIMTVLLTVPLPTSAQRAKIGIVDTVEGVGTVAREAAESRSLGPNDDLLIQDKIMTGSGSILRIRFTTDATTTMRERSVVTISEEKGQPVLHLERGVLYYRGPRERNRGDEVRAILTPNAAVRTAGGIGVATRALDAVVETTVCAMEGNGFAAALGGAETEVPERHCVTISGNVPGPVLPLSPAGTGLLSCGGIHLSGHCLGRVY